MFKINNLLNNLKYNKQGRLVQELKDLQERKELVNKEISKIKIMPNLDLKVRNCYDKNHYYLADLIAQLWLGKIDADKFNSEINKMYKIENATNYFNDLGEYFINISENTKDFLRLDTEFKELNEKEYELKKRLKIK